jgi:hypothetical protein
MKYESEYGTVDFWDPYPRLNDFKKIGINLSGGCDSALVMFMTCRELIARDKLDVVIHPITGVHNKRPTNIWNAEEIVELFREMFPAVEIGEHFVDYYDKDHEKDKTNQHLKHETRLREEGKIEVLFHGRTANPDKDEAEKHNLLYKREERRDKHGNEREPFHEHHDKPFYCPMEFVDKRFVADIYRSFGLMENLFPLTASCVAYGEETDYFTKPCKECWWCREKKWAFGMYDGCVT